MAKSKAKAEVFDLGAIALALDNGSVTEALEAALIAWRQTRAPALADLVDVIASKLAAPEIASETAWAAAARDRDPAMIGALVASLPELPASFLPTAGEALAGYADDPRIAMAVARWALDPLATASQNYPFWTKTLDAMSRAGDRRVVALLKKRLKLAPGSSTFWPKFYKGLERAIAKIDKTPVVRVDDKAIAKLVKAARALDDAVVEAAPAKPATPKLDGPALGQAASHLEAGRVQPAIEAMLAAWRDGRAPAIADTIDRATKLLPTWDRALAASDKAAEAAWNAAFAADPQAAMPQLLEYLITGGPQVAERHLMQLATLPEDPRVGVRLAQLASGRWISPERTQYWKSTFELIAKVRDPRTVTALRVAFGTFEGTYYNHHRQARRIISEWALNPPEPPMLGPQETADLARIAAAIDKLEAQRDTTERTLVDAIATAWNDSGPRLVYADWLTERQHPRGELIVLACKESRTAAEAKRLQNIVRKTLNMCGPLDAFGRMYADDRGLGLERGLPTLVPCDFTTSLLSWQPLVGYPLMAFVTTIENRDSRVLPDSVDLARVIMDPTARRLATVKNIPEELWIRLKPRVDGKWVRNGNDLVRA